MRVIPWETIVEASWTRDLELENPQFPNGVLQFEVATEEKRWLLRFGSVQAWKVTAEEYAGLFLSMLPEEGALFIVEESPWPRELDAVEELQKSKHFVVCCYDEVIEVLAWDCVIAPVRASE